MRKPRGFPLPDPPWSGDQIPSPAVGPENALENSNRNLTETTIFIVVSRIFGPFFGDVPKSRKSHDAESATIRDRFRGVRVCDFFFCSSNFFLGSLGPLRPKDGPETPIFIAFPRFFSVQIFPSPRPTSSRNQNSISAFFEFGLQNAPQNSPPRGANSVARIPPSFPTCVCSFFGCQKWLS